MQHTLATLGLTDWAFLVHIAAITQVVGYLIRNQLILRTLLLAGTGFYVAYYWLYPTEPLWHAIYWGVALGMANLLSILLILKEQARFRMSLEEELLYRAFDRMPPGQFRRLMSVAEFRTADPETVLTTQGQHPDELYYVIYGDILIDKDDRQITYPAASFIGELAMITSEPASATVRLKPGSTYVAWDRQKLSKLVRHRPGLQLAFDKLVTSDVAAKLQRA